MAFYGVALDNAVDEINFKIRLVLKKKGINGLRTLAKTFHDYDFNGNNRLEFKEFKAALESMGIFTSIVELQALMAYYDTNKDGGISYGEFLQGIREPMSERRQALVQQIFAMLDKNGSGSITRADIENCYRVESSPDFISGAKTKQEVLENFLNNFDLAQKSKDGVITKEEFFNYYADLSMVLPVDDYFVSVLEGAWNAKEEFKVMAEQENEKAKEPAAALVEKLMKVAPPLDDKTIEKVFKDFNKSKTGGISIEEMQQTFERFEIPVDRKIVMGVIKMFDKNKSGALEYEEFRDLIKAFI